jgi:hypothetical protein
LDAVPPPPIVQQEPPYAYAATDIRPRQAKEIELCERASHFDWMYTGAFALLYATSVYVNIDKLKQIGPASVRMIGPITQGFFWGGLLSGGYLSLPKCDPLWAQGPPPEGNVRAQWPIATAIAVLSGITAPILDYVWLGQPKVGWAVEERTARVFVSGAFGVIGSLFPYVLPPRTWAAAKEIEKMRIDGYRDGWGVSYNLAF